MKSELVRITSYYFLLTFLWMPQITWCFTPAYARRSNHISHQDFVTAHGISATRRRQEEGDEGRLPAQLESPVDDERRPFRTTASLQPDKVYFNDWGVERYDHPEPYFPDTIDSLTDAAWEAVAGTLYGKQRLDPNLASNAMSSSIYGYRPVRGEKDVGRIGLEIDGANFLFPNDPMSSGSAIRRVALQLGAKLSHGPWEGFEDEGPDSRPVAIYFNTIRQSLIASQELRLLKRIALEQDGTYSRYDNITIQCMKQDDDIPEHMQRSKLVRGGLREGTVEPSQGIVVIVQPTDYNTEFRPPGPSVGAVEALQQLVARASVHALPVVLISPRFLALDHYLDGGMDQSGFQRSAIYGGHEPPKGPTPWVMRDFTPPVFAWVGCALPLSPHRQSMLHSGEQKDHRTGHVDERSRTYRYARVVLTQSAMQEGHPWHIFAAKEYGAPNTTPDHTSYQYLASTKTSSGRPPKDILRHVFNEWT